MRWLILPVVLIILQLLSYGLAWAIQWFMRPYYVVPFKWLLLAVLLLSNGVIALGFLGAFRLTTGYLAVLWLGFLSAIISAVLIGLGVKLGIGCALLNRVLAGFMFVGLIAFAVFNAYVPVVRHLTVAIDKSMPTPVTLAVASDLHLGSLFGRRELSKLERILSQNNVDVLLMPGDIMDDNTQSFEQLQMAEQFKHTLSAVNAVSVASLGNHDLYQQSAYAAIRQAIIDGGAVLLDDKWTAITVNKNGKQSTIQIAGRFDDHYGGRLDTADIVATMDNNLPIIVLDHRPSQIDDNSLLPIDLQVSGHTHNGQIFPANFIVQAINRVGYGYENINGTHFLVTSGFGFWGIPFRLGSRSEVWVVELVGRS